MSFILQSKSKDPKNNGKVLATVPGILLFSCSILAQETPPLPMQSEDFADTSDQALISSRETVTIVEDSNVAESIARRPDLQFNNVTIDGERSSISLNDIPADAVSEIELLRAVTPEMDADTRGGSINLSSNPTYNLEKPVIKADSWARYSMGESTWVNGSSASYSRSLGDFGFRISTSFERNHDITQGFYMRWSEAVTTDPAYSPDYLSASHQEDWEINYNFGTAFDYRFSDKLNAFVRFNYSETAHEGYQPVLFYRYSQGYIDTERSLTSQMALQDAQVDRDLTAWESRWHQFDFLAGINFEGNTWKGDIRLLGEFQNYLEPDWFIIQFRTDPVALSYGLNSKNIPIVQSASIDLNDPDQFVFDELLSERWEDSNDRWVASANIRHDFEILDWKAYAKTGLKWTLRKKDQQSDSRIYTSYVGDFRLSDIASDSNAESLMLQNFNWGVFPTLADSRDYFAEHFDQFVYDLKRSAQKGDPATYDADESIASAYAVLNLTHHRIRSILGFRVEQTHLNYHARAVLIDEDGNYVSTEKQSGSNRYTNFFPSAHVRYFLGSRTTLIGSWTGTIERPYFSYTVPYREINYDSKSIDEGNPKLKPTIYHNFDISIDYKLTDSSLLSVELFSKDVEDIVYWDVTDLTNGQYAGFSLGTNKNGPSATERGIRFILTQDLSDFSDYLEGFHAILKYSFQDTDTEYPGRAAESLAVTNRPENTFEATLTYQDERWFAQLKYAYESVQLVSVYDAAWQDKYNIPVESLSLNTSYNINDRMRVFCDLDGLLESYAKTYFGVPDRPSAYAWRSKKIEFGIKLNL